MCGCTFCSNFGEWRNSLSLSLSPFWDRNDDGWLCAKMAHFQKPLELCVYFDRSITFHAQRWYVFQIRFISKQVGGLECAILLWRISIVYFTIYAIDSRFACFLVITKTSTSTSINRFVVEIRLETFIMNCVRWQHGSLSNGRRQLRMHVRALNKLCDTTIIGNNALRTSTRFLYMQ